MIKKTHWEKNLFELIRRTSTDLPSDVELALKRAAKKHKKGTSAHDALQSIQEAVVQSREQDLPLCRDTGTLIFYFGVPVGFDTNALTARARAAVSRATRKGYLSQNTTDSVTGAAYKTNIAHGTPVFYFRQGARKTVDVRLVIYGSCGDRNSRQFQMPTAFDNATDHFDAVIQCALETLRKAKNKACSPGILGVCIGGTRATGYVHAGEQFLHKVGEKSRVKSLARLEQKIRNEARKLAKDTTGAAGQSSLLGVNVGALSRLPETCYITVAYMCWALRRRGVLLGPEGGIHRWLY